MREAGLPIKALSFYSGNEDRMRHFEEFLSREANLTALFTCRVDDTIAIRHLLTSRGVRIPQDFSIITVTEGVVDRLGPEMSSYLLPEREMGRLAVNMLLEKIAASQKHVNSVALPLSFNEGACLAPAPGND